MTADGTPSHREGPSTESHQASRVLLVSPDADLLELLELAFRMAGFEVNTASSALDAMTREAQPPDVAILDAAIGKLVALTVVAHLRQDGRVPAIVLTEPGDEGTIDSWPDVESMQKPFSHRELIARIRTLVSESAA